MTDDTPDPTPTSKFEHERHLDLDPKSTTGLFKATVQRKYWKRKSDTPLWFVMTYHALKGMIGLLPYVLAALLLHRCGVSTAGIFGQ